MEAGTNQFTTNSRVLCAGIAWVGGLDSGFHGPGAVVNGSHCTRMFTALAALVPRLCTRTLIVFTLPFTAVSGPAGPSSEISGLLKLSLPGAGVIWSSGRNAPT